MHIVEVEYLIENELRRIVQESHPLDWKEDVITHELMKALRRRLDSTTLHGLHYPITMDWEIYKLHGTRESTHGDVGMLFRYLLPSGAIVEGAGFLEAKIRGRESVKFHAVRHDQVSRILERSPHTQLLLYDYTSVTVLDDVGTFDRGDYDMRFASKLGYRSYARVTHGPVLPLSLAAAVNHYDDTLYRFCHSLSHQFTRRYFHLHDLDFTEAAIRAVKGFPCELGSPNYIMVIRSAPIGQNLPETHRPSENLYTQINKEG